jgi:predicted nucleic acid-binding protein
MSIYVDTSALLAVLDADDAHHAPAKETWINLLESGETMICNNYILLETYALVQHRLGMAAVRAFHVDVFPVLKVIWLNDAQHLQAANALLTANRRNLSLADCASFTTMRQLSVKQSFTFDKHFIEQGFTCLPRENHL